MVWLGAEIMQVMLPIVHLIGPLVLIIVVGLVRGLSGLLSDAFRKSLSDFSTTSGCPRC